MRLLKSLINGFAIPLISLMLALGIVKLAHCVSKEWLIFLIVFTVGSVMTYIFYKNS